MRTAADPRRVATIPNAISVARLAAAPVFCWLLADGDRTAAFWLLAVLGATDWVDGWIARRLGQESTLGKILDPTADRLLLLSAAAALLIDGVVPLVVGIVVLVREAVVSLATLALAMAGATRIDVQWVGKAGTFALMFGLPGFLLAEIVGAGARDAVTAAAWLLSAAGIALSYLALVRYVPLARRALAAGRVPEAVA